MLVETIICHCVCDDLLKAFGYVDDPQCKMGSAEVMTAGLVAAFYFGGNIQAARRYLPIEHATTMPLRKNSQLMQKFR